MRYVEDIDEWADLLLTAPRTSTRVDRTLPIMGCIERADLAAWKLAADRMCAFRLMAHLRDIERRPTRIEDIASAHAEAGRLVERGWGEHIGPARRLHTALSDALDRARDHLHLRGRAESTRGPRQPFHDDDEEHDAGNEVIASSDRHTDQASYY